MFSRRAFPNSSIPGDTLLTEIPRLRYLLLPEGSGKKETTKFNSIPESKHSFVCFWMFNKIIIRQSILSSSFHPIQFGKKIIKPKETIAESIDSLIRSSIQSVTVFRFTRQRKSATMSTSSMSCGRSEAKDKESIECMLSPPIFLLHTRQDITQEEKKNERTNHFQKGRETKEKRNGLCDERGDGKSRTEREDRRRKKKRHNTVLLPWVHFSFR